MLANLTSPGGYQVTIALQVRGTSLACCMLARIAVILPPTAFAFQDGLEAHAQLAEFRVSSLAETEEARQTVLQVLARPATHFGCVGSQERTRWFASLLCHFPAKCGHVASLQAAVIGIRQDIVFLQAALWLPFVRLIGQKLAQYVVL